MDRAARDEHFSKVSRIVRVCRKLHDEFAYVAVCCSVLQCVTVYCSVLQCVEVCRSVLQCVAVCCSVLQCLGVCCSEGVFYGTQSVHCCQDASSDMGWLWSVGSTKL